MKKKSIVLIITIIICITLLFGINYVKADSGWDYDYDSGGGWDSGYDYGGGWDYDYDYGDSWGSDYDYDWNWSNNNSSSGNYADLSPFFISITIGFIICVVIVAIYFNSYNNGIRKAKKTEKRIINDPSNYSLSYYLENKNRYREITEQEVWSKLGMSSSEFRRLVFNIYKNIQNAWTEFDYKKLHKYTTDEIYNSYVMQLDTLKLKNQKNIMTDIECIDVKIYNIKEENGILNIDVYMNIRMFDYVEGKNGHVVRGTSKRKVNIEYELTFVKSNKKSSKKSTICPNCGAKIPATARGKCEYCGSVVVIDAKEFVMSRKTCINQRMD